MSATCTRGPDETVNLQNVTPTQLPAPNIICPTRDVTLINVQIMMEDGRMSCC